MNGKGNASNQLPYGGVFQPHSEHTELRATLEANIPYQYPIIHPPQQQFNYEQIQQQQDIELEQQMRAFWAAQNNQIENMCDFKNHGLSLERIKKIMKFDEDVRMISAEAPRVLAKACEMFIKELTMRSWNQTEENLRRTLRRNDISVGVARTDHFDFLVDIIPKEEDVLIGTERGAMHVPPPTTEDFMPTTTMWPQTGEASFSSDN